MNAAPRVLARIAGLLAAAAPDERGALWQLAEPGRELDANLVRLPPGAEVGEHQEDVLDVLLVVLEGAGSVRAGDGQVLDLAAGAVLWLPRTSRRALTAGPDGLTYLTVHRRRPGLAIKPPGGAYEGGEGPCMLDRVCPECGRLSQDPAPVFCSRCGERFPER
ncbi:cupin domain-containing protein [Streptomyces sp. f150]|uniref:cupin domain-containing protein n=1 Tax=Streptomyces sp. f150 TaxID=1827699 RepID=UPI000BF21C63|nr:cupin domain-containing protein [Streptomyces sp. f150]